MTVLAELSERLLNSGKTLDGKHQPDRSRGDLPGVCSSRLRGQSALTDSAVIGVGNDQPLDHQQPLSTRWCLSHLNTLRDTIQNAWFLAMLKLDKDCPCVTAGDYLLGSGYEQLPLTQWQCLAWCIKFGLQLESDCYIYQFESEKQTHSIPSAGYQLTMPSFHPPLFFMSLCHHLLGWVNRPGNK